MQIYSRWWQITSDIGKASLRTYIFTLANRNIEANRRNSWITMRKWRTAVARKFGRVQQMNYTHFSPWLKQKTIAMGIQFHCLRTFSLDLGNLIGHLGCYWGKGFRTSGILGHKPRPRNDAISMLQQVRGKLLYTVDSLKSNGNSNYYYYYCTEIAIIINMAFGMKDGVNRRGIAAQQVYQARNGGRPTRRQPSAAAAAAAARRACYSHCVHAIPVSPSQCDFFHGDCSPTTPCRHHPDHCTIRATTVYSHHTPWISTP